MAGLREVRLQAAGNQTVRYQGRHGCRRRGLRHGVTSTGFFISQLLQPGVTAVLTFTKQ
jgi:hypothetical protein